MRRMMLVLILVAALIPLLCLPAVAQSGGATVQLSGVVQSFSGGTLDIKPATSPAVWVMVPSGLAIDRNALKAGAHVRIEANWSDVCYIATQVTIQR
jgi:hypothetical protein